jgi:hypothetical protein
MYFCPQCKYMFDVKKGTVDVDKTPIESIIDLFKIIKTKEDLNKYKATFNYNELKDNLKYNKLSEEEKNNIENLFKNQSSGAIFYCTNCAYQENITKSIKLYEVNFKDTDQNITNIDDLKLLIHDPTLPRTKDYMCKNINCITHKDLENKEAIYFKEKTSYKLNYVCTQCYTTWNL